MLAFLGPVGWPELLVILIIALLIFGNRLPEVMRNLGKSVNEFKKGMGEMGDGSQQPFQQPYQQPQHPPQQHAPPPAQQPAPPAAEEPKKPA